MLEDKKKKMVRKWGGKKERMHTCIHNTPSAEKKQENDLCCIQVNLVCVML